MSRRLKTRECRRFDGTPKKRHENEADAAAMANPDYLEGAYHCRICDGWHVGHKRGTDRRKLLNLRLEREARARKAAKRKADLS